MTIKAAAQQPARLGDIAGGGVVREEVRPLQQEAKSNWSTSITHNMINQGEGAGSYEDV